MRKLSKSQLKNQNMPKKNAQSDKNILNSKIKPKTLNFQINLRSEMFAKFYQRI